MKNEDIVLLTIAFPFVLVLSAFLFKTAIGTLSLTRFTPYVFGYYVAFLCQGLFGIYFALWGARSHQGFNLIVGDEPYILSTIAVISGVLLTPISMIWTAKLLNVDPRLVSIDYLNRKVTDYLTKNDSASFFTLCGAVALMAIVCAYILSNNSALVLSLLKDSSLAEIAEARVSGIYGSELERIITNIFGSSFSSVLVYIIFAFCIHKMTFRWWALLALQLPISLIIQTSALEKGPAAQLIIGLIFVYVFVKGRASLKTTLVASGCVAAALIASYTLAGIDIAHGVDDGGILGGDNPIGRTFIGQVAGMPNYIQVFPKQHEFLQGTDLQALSLLGVKTESAGRIALAVQYPESAARGLIGMQNTFFTGGAYANFGWVGVLIGPLWVGFVLQLIQLIALKVPKNPIAIGWTVWIMYQYMRAVGGGFMSEFTLNTNVFGTTVLTIAMAFAITQLQARQDRSLRGKLHLGLRPANTPTTTN